MREKVEKWKSGKERRPRRPRRRISSGFHFSSIIRNRLAIPLFHPTEKEKNPPVESSSTGPVRSRGDDVTGTGAVARCQWQTRWGDEHVWLKPRLPPGGGRGGTWENAPEGGRSLRGRDPGPGPMSGQSARSSCAVRSRPLRSRTRPATAFISPAIYANYRCII